MTAVAAGPPAAQPPPRERVLVRSGAELVAVSERLYGGMFAGAIAFAGVAALASLAVLPLRGDGLPGGRPTAGLVLTALLVLAAPWGVRHAPALQRLVRRSAAAEAAAVAVAGVLLLHPLRTELWWPSCAILMALAVLGTPPRALGQSAVVVATGLGSHWLAGDLPDLAGVTVVGLCIGYPLWTCGIAATSDILAAQILRLDAAREVRPAAPRRVAAWVTRPTGVEDPPDPGGLREDGPAPAPTAGGPHAGPAGTAARLTPRQVQVVALLSDGLRYADVAACLSISQRQVQRHVSQAVRRLGVRNAYELVAVAMAEGIVPR